ncbi:MAG: phosphate starvation-inducible protein PhoH [Candidatus Sumerlaeota bacterium]|nr:phosphate starvation-inducible protein PhoH [Candidatus Sumerlaeota bacterium]
MPELIETSIMLSQAEAVEFCGRNDEKIRELQGHLEAKLVLRGNRLKIIGSAEEVERTSHVIQEILEVVRQRGRLSDHQFRSAMRYAAERARSGLVPVEGALPAERETEKRAGEKLTDYLLEPIHVPLKRRRLSPLTATQRDYIMAIRQNTIIFGIGPAGTGKTYLAMAMAVASLTAGEVNRIILCRPAVEAGERLGFLPGDLAQKFDPYVRPLWDALYEMMEAERIREAVASGVIEIAPLAYMRGRTLNNAFVILDEGQNTTIEQMKMFLTRLGFESKAVITGDVTQVDLPRGQTSGLVHAHRILTNIEGVGFTRFSNRDVVRHPLLTKIINAYEQDKKNEKEAAESAAHGHLRAAAPRLPSTQEAS